MGLTPMMQQYITIKESHKDCILFFRLGDFYEMFFEDAILAAKELEITLTGRDGGQTKKVPMCGIPYHSADAYIARLIEKGYKVAICEQVEDPKAVKGIVKREVVRVVTPGTLLESQMLKEKQNNFLVAISSVSEEFGLAVVDFSTGQFLATVFEGNKAKEKLLDEIGRLQPAEGLIQESLFNDNFLLNELEQRGVKTLTSYPNWSFEVANGRKILEEHFKVFDVESLGCGKSPSLLGAAGAILDYLKDTQKGSLAHLNQLDLYNTENYMIVDNGTRRNLELTKTLREGSTKGSLLWVLDFTITAMGGRLLKTWVERPLLNLTEIQNRLNSVEELIEQPALRHELRLKLKTIYDLERIISRVVYGSANAKDLVGLRQSLQQLPEIKNLLSEFKFDYLKVLGEDLDPQVQLSQLLEMALSDDPPFSLKDGGIIKEGYNFELDNLRRARREGKDWIANLETKERERTGIKSLKVGFNKVFGYYIEVTKANLSLVPADFTRKQTLANGERFITPQLKEYENLILGAEEKINQLEYQLFLEIREKVAQQTEAIQKSAQIVAVLDCLLSFTEAALNRGYVKPVVTKSKTLKIKEGRHPVVEAMLAGNSFIPNDTLIGESDNLLSLITGPNMAGKSTYMRQVALIVLLAQIGSFVPANSAEIGIVDRIFTRVGASDDLATGQSTFMVEMLECQIIINGATEKSLVIMDEVGRGTSTYDGISIARALAEYLYEKIGCKTLFSTHYHELTDLEGNYSGIKNYTVAVKEKGEDIIFLRKVIAGKADRSYGIHVAKLAGFPKVILQRAESILQGLEEGISYSTQVAATGQINLFDLGLKEEVLEDTVKLSVVEELKSLEILTITPLEAINKLYELKKKLS